MPGTTNETLTSAEEVLDFVNYVRQAVGHAPLKSLRPSVPGNRRKCLIANQMDFKCSVSCDVGGWVIAIPFDLTSTKLDLVVDSDIDSNGYVWYQLPPEIGWAAAMFDAKTELQEYATNGK